MRKQTTETLWQVWGLFGWAIMLGIAIAVHLAF